MRNSKANRPGEKYHCKGRLLQFPRGGTYHALRGHMEKYQGWSGGRRRRDTVGMSLYCGFYRKEWVRQVSRLRIGQVE